MRVKLTATAVARVLLFFIWVVGVVVGCYGGIWRGINHGGHGEHGGKTRGINACAREILKD
jgi:hypothetical protein